MNKKRVVSMAVLFCLLAVVLTACENKDNESLTKKILADTSTENNEKNNADVNGTNTEVEDIPESYKVTPRDADAYYESNSAIISKVNAQESETVHTEAETYENISDRGFTQYTITSEYSIDGEYYPAADISDEASTKHPIYETYYVTAAGDIWTIFEINGVIMANPVSYNMQSDLGVQVIISESDTVISYDGATNQFYTTIPNESALIVKTVGRIDAESLEKLTIEEIDGL